MIIVFTFPATHSILHIYTLLPGQWRGVSQHGWPHLRQVNANSSAHTSREEIQDHVERHADTIQASIHSSNMVSVVKSIILYAFWWKWISFNSITVYMCIHIGIMCLRVHARLSNVYLAFWTVTSVTLLLFYFQCVLILYLSLLSLNKPYRFTCTVYTVLAYSHNSTCVLSGNTYLVNILYTIGNSPISRQCVHFYRLCIMIIPVGSCFYISSMCMHNSVFCTYIVISLCCIIVMYFSHQETTQGTVFNWTEKGTGKQTGGGIEKGKIAWTTCEKYINACEMYN